MDILMFCILEVSMNDLFSNLESLSSNIAINYEKKTNQEKISFLQRKPPRHKVGEKFLKGPIPWAWILKAGCIPGKALHVAIYIWHLAGINGVRTVSINLSQFNANWGFDRSTASKALKALELAKLVKVIRSPGKKPQVTLLDVDQKTDGLVNI